MPSNFISKCVFLVFEGNMVSQIDPKITILNHWQHSHLPFPLLGIKSGRSESVGAKPRALPFAKGKYRRSLFTLFP